jgi:hypothetical protein
MGCYSDMNTFSRYWKMWCINPAMDKLGYKQISVTMAQEFTKNHVSDVEDSNNIQKFFFSCFNARETHTDNIKRAQAGLCLRCYVSEAILKACKKIDYLFSGQKQFTYQDLLQFVLDDDGKKLIILDQDGKTQLIVDDNNQIKISKYKFFSVTVLQTFNADLQSQMSLDNWAYLQTKQNHELKKFLSEFGFSHLSDWALLNRVKVKQMERLLTQERYIVEAFHTVYRRDRQMQRHKGAKKCPDPTNAQLQEMLAYLQQYQVSVNTPAQLMKELRNIASQLRKYDVWSLTEPLDRYDFESGKYQSRRDLPVSYLDEADLEKQELSEFLYQNLEVVLSDVIQQEVEDNVNKLRKSKKYAPFADKYIQGLQLYYCQTMSLKEIVPELGMTSWDQARRIINPGELLEKVRMRTVERMLGSILQKAAEKGLTQIPPSANYLKTLMEQIEVYVDAEVFQAAAEEIRTGKNRKMTSIYAEKLRGYIQAPALVSQEVAQYYSVKLESTKTRRLG